ncbi:hypothetical protein Cob_v012579 [Colletotrichum orbiculare MAFF 240422]|uniref:Uncharacterized protein n=1 Tax=Colletotrichum orbiculare (strain 104-T / ATCC 96160 / CBS 514.97 / LARS 414 / MAFF 240422) TaxID=1213857 RepID=A0A484F9A1_COLOR|nr:hypothetical protein Cob_v012579 [Colletotrichum orbiculare MAFF 240422]
MQKPLCDDTSVLVKRAWDNLNLNIALSKSKLQHLAHSPLARQLLRMPPRAVADAGLAVLSARKAYLEIVLAVWRPSIARPETVALLDKEMQDRYQALASGSPSFESRSPQLSSVLPPGLDVFLRDTRNFLDEIEYTAMNITPMTKELLLAPVVSAKQNEDTPGKEQAINPAFAEDLTLLGRLLTEKFSRAWNFEQREGVSV